MEGIKTLSRYGIFGILIIFILTSCLPSALSPEDEETCINQEDNFLQAQCYHILAVIKKNESYCDKMSLNYEDTATINKILCYSDLARIKTNPKICEKSIDKIECYAQLSRNLNDATVCDNLEDDGDKSICKNKLL